MPSYAVLELEPRRTIVRSSDIGEGTLLAVPIGWAQLAEAFGDPLSLSDIELGIERVEEAIGHPDVKLARRLPARSDETLRLLSHAATGQDSSGSEMTIEAVETAFARLAAQASGALPLAERLPEDARFAATLLIVREFMHHLHVNALLLDPPG